MSTEVLAGPTGPVFVRLTSVVHWIGFFGGPVAAGLLYLLLSASCSPVSPAPVGQLGEAGLLTLCVGVWMAVWWVTEPVAAAVTALLPIVVFPLIGVLTFKQAAAGYADNLVVLFFAGFILGEALQRWGVHKRFALLTVLAFGTRPSFIVLGIMCATAFVSMWVSNTAAAVMMMPIAISLAKLTAGGPDHPAVVSDPWPARSVHNFSVCLLLAVAYGASLGGIGTPIGTPPNLQMSAYANAELGRPISFASWMIVAGPILLICLPLVWLLLVRLHPTGRTSLPGGRDELRSSLRTLGPLSREEWGVVIIFVLAAGAWIARQPLVDMLNSSARMTHAAAIAEWESAVSNGKTALASVRPADFVVREFITDAGIGLIAVMALFVIPFRARTDGFLMQWKHCTGISWGTLLLFGGGLSLAAAMKSSGLESYLGTIFESLRGLPKPLFLLLLAAGIVAISEVASNTALAAAIIPILGAAAPGLGLDPIALLMVATLAASCGFALPVATPPNAIAYATGRLPLHHMIRMGVLVDVLCILVIVGVFTLFGDSLLRLANLDP